jgi:ABC-2 type transport system permease protein
MTPFSATLRSEWTKLTSLRSTKVMVALGVILGIALTAVLAIVVGETYDKWDAAGRREFEPIGSALIGGVICWFLFLVLGVKAATAEYGSGMIRLTLTATPQRWRVLAAKAAVLAAITAVSILVVNLGMFLVAQPILASYGVETASLWDSDVVRAVLGNAALAPVFPVIALALGFLLRSTAAAIVSVFAFIFAPPFLGELLPRWFREELIPYLPGDATDAIALGHLEGAADGLSPGIASVMVVAWLALFLGAAWVAFERRDA